MQAINFVIYNTDMEHPNKGQSLNYELKIEFTSLSFLDKLIKNIDSALTLWLALLIISFKCLLKFSFVLTLILSNFSYTVFFFFFI